jgi:hypothetical protein
MSHTADPFATANPDYPTGPNVSTFRITSMDLEREITVVQDYRTKSTLRGFAAIGGLGSFFSAFFVILFGNTLLGIVNRTSFTLITRRITSTNYGKEQGHSHLSALFTTLNERKTVCLANPMLDTLPSSTISDH